MYTNTSNEKNLVLLLSEDNQVAFEKLYHLYSPRLMGYLIKLVKSESYSCELLQDVFIKIWGNRHKLDADRSFRSYLFRIAENVVYDFFRKAASDKKLQSELTKITLSGYSHVEENFCVKEDEQILHDVIALLPPKRRQVFQLIKMEEHSYEEVSGLLNISTSTISDHIVKANKFIQEQLKAWHVTAINILVFFLL